MKRLHREEGLLSRLALLGIVLALLWLVTGCSSSGSESAAAVLPELEPTAVIATATAGVTLTPEPVELLAEAGPDTCTDCHTDQAMLIDTADPVAEVVSENEGEG